ncbi:hypothetical protein I7I53_11179 [Histoplasma capsulatum var. duboisii H88]|uniref:Uncharacterized protein n=1 Tax=Ajellomyces capsulatus (strain H88) TaxID=544711 RepID=A0A8A1LDF1_AJEC8|nr:hypothetical protein I7I53_11179 [Histoplasma capsulatum var. duboisii H88]
MRRQACRRCWNSHNKDLPGRQPGYIRDLTPKISTAVPPVIQCRPSFSVARHSVSPVIQYRLSLILILILFIIIIIIIYS